MYLFEFIPKTILHIQIFKLNTVLYMNSNDNKLKHEGVNNAVIFLVHHASSVIKQ